jgi:putative nucleotidyltransferase with HDIG domain
MHWLKRMLSQQAHDAGVERDPTRAHLAALLESLATMAWLVEARDPYTGGHLWRVARYAGALAEVGRLPPSQVGIATLGGFLHDIGKVGVPDAILGKRGPLDPDEMAVMRAHPMMGVRMLAAHPLAYLVKDAVALHHERPDGQGYPGGVAGDRIPVVARIVGICDAFDAMTSDRPYRRGMSTREALDRLHGGRGSQFDAAWVDRFLELPAGVIDAIRGHSSDGIPLHDCPACGLTVVQQSDDAEGDTAICPSCASEFAFVAAGPEGLLARPTGRRAAPGEPRDVVDAPLIRRMVRDLVARLPVVELAGNTVSP